MSAEMEGLTQAEAYKEDGNHEFQKKQYRIAIDNYTEGIKGRCSDRLLNAVLYTNRAAAQFHLGHHRSALNDCIFACKFKPDHIKALHRGALCCLEMKKYEDCVHWCDRALAVSFTLVLKHS
ncbi:tetratricopeptide repeat protein 4-like [Dreissena polymorpha]|uniref:tetratricopeptide repeat protein 4-like n=1 Tax=Dreissena polymorpha TaxID=45954 RepID=UPI0022645732|nr:tetratricopeptide repeat protein 4-like [Dreissena polymorpha]